jgi:hypothetical protein
MIVILDLFLPKSVVREKKLSGTKDGSITSIWESFSGEKAGEGIVMMTVAREPSTWQLKPLLSLSEL